MINYGETSAVPYKRAKRVVIDYELYQLPVTTYECEKIVSEEGVDIHIPINGCSVVFDPTEVVTMRNPATGEPLGATITKAEAAAVLFSVGWHDMEKNNI